MMISCSMLAVWMAVTLALWIDSNSFGVIAPPPPPFPDSSEFMYYPEQKIAGATGSASQFGECVAISGDGLTAVVGGAGDVNIAGFGAVWMYARLGNGTWVQQGDKLFPNDVVGDSELFGYACAISFEGDTIAVGEMVAASVGGMWVFSRLPNNTWTQQGGRLVGTEYVGPVVQQGLSVALSGDGNIALSGGPMDDSARGAVWVFNKSSTTGEWSQVGAKLYPDDATFPAFGWSIRLSRDASVALIGGVYDSSNAGAAWVYNLLPNGSYVQAQPKLLSWGSPAAQLFGGAVAISSDGSTSAIAGLANSTSPGSLWIFQRLPNGTFSPMESILVLKGWVGRAPSLINPAVSTNHDGSVIITAGYGDDDYQGATWVFYRYPNQTYAQQEPKLHLTNGTLYQGWSLSMDDTGTRFLSGQPYDLGFDIGSFISWEFVDLNIK